MNENIIAVNVPNAVSIALMGAAGFLLFTLAHKAIARRGARQAAG